MALYSTYTKSLTLFGVLLASARKSSRDSKLSVLSGSMLGEGAGPCLSLTGPIPGSVYERDFFCRRNGLPSAVGALGTRAAAAAPAPL